MSDQLPQAEPAALPADYPGKTAVFPAPIERLVYGIFGLQSRAPAAGARNASELESLFAQPDGPAKVEQLQYRDAEGADCEVYLGFWSDPARYQRWSDAAFQPWWNGLPLQGTVGFWREVVNAHKDYYQYGAGVPEKGGIAALGELAPCDKFGYWGGYRDRVPASVRDDFAPALERMPERVLKSTLGRRLRVETPDNLCFIREGQGWDQAGPEERRIWQEQMEPVVARWVATLAEKPAETGCFDLRFCKELDYRSKARLEKQSQLAFLLSLGHIEKAARTTRPHLEVKKTFTGMYTQPKFTPRMHVWVEMLIVKRGELSSEYLNCHPGTGFLPYFEPVEIG